MGRYREDYLRLKELGWSQEDIATICRSSRPTINKFIKDRTMLDFEQMEKYKVLVDLDISYPDFKKEAFKELIWKPAYKRLARSNDG